MPVLADATVWSLLLRRKQESPNQVENRLITELSPLIREGEAQMPGMVRFELLSGMRDAASFLKLKDRLRVFDDTSLEWEDYELGAELWNSAQSMGIVGSDIDLLLCAISLRRNWPVFTTDKDFRRYQKFCSLKLHSV